MLTIVRKEQAADLKAIREVNTQAFGQPQEADIVDKLRRNCDNFLSLIALLTHRIAGHIFFSPATIDHEDKVVHGMGLAPMAVLPDYQRQGIGGELIRSGIDRLKARNFPFLIVLGHADYYPRFGFEPAHRHAIRCEWDVPDEAFMIYILDKSVMQKVSGVAKYRLEFAEAM